MLFHIITDSWLAGLMFGLAAAIAQALDGGVVGWGIGGAVATLAAHLLQFALMLIYPGDDNDIGGDGDGAATGWAQSKMTKAPEGAE